MARDPLAILWRLRDAEVTAASRNLAAARTDHAREQRRLDEQHASMLHERTQAGHEHVAAFAAWLPHAHEAAARLQANAQREQGKVLQLQQVLTRRRTDAEAVVQAIQRQADKTKLARARHDQAVMDEVASRSGQGRRLG